MKAILLKVLFALTPIFAILAALFYMYFSHDVTLLKTQYPSVKVEGREVRYLLQKNPPEYWVKLDEISPYLVGAIVLSEDWSFYQHEGVDLEQLKEVLGDISFSKRMRGASTITQQMVKNVLLSSSRNLWRKLHEAILAKKVEQHLSKKRILEIYLNSIQYGPRHFGIKSAAKYYFKKHPRDLTPRESAFVAMLLPSPTKFSVSFRNKKLSQFAKGRIEEILIKMRQGKVITPGLYRLVRTQRFDWELN